VKKGIFIVLEGGEGAGKSTVASFLRHSLSGKEFLITRAGESPFGENLRALFVSDDADKASPESRFALTWAAQADHTHHIVVPALAAGQHVISDRFDASIFAYQVCGEEAPHMAKLFWDTRATLLRETTPDLYIFLDVSVEDGFARLKAHGKKLDHFERRPRDFHERVREGYKEFFTNVPHIVVDASRPLEDVQKNVLNHIQEFISKSKK